MKNLKTIGTALVFTAMLVTIGGGSAYACTPPEPGQTDTPPCTSAQLVTDVPSTPGQLETPPSSSTFDMASTVEEAVVAFLLF